VLIYVPTTLTLVILSIILVKRFGLEGDHGKAWILFAIFASLWFIAERIVMYYNLATGAEPFPSEADVFWLAGYPFLFAFLLFYLKPVKEMISKKILTFACSVAIASLALCMAYKIDTIFEADLLATIIGILYPLSDAILLAPAIIGVILFFRGKVNFLWSLICIAIMLEIIADTVFLFITIDDVYYQGHPVDILFIWFYVILSFGVYHHITIFKDHKKDLYKDIEKLK
jgi:hypothetical protein